MHSRLPHFRRLLPLIALAYLAIPSFCQSQTPQKPSSTVPPILFDSAKPVDDISVKAIEQTPCGDPQRRFYNSILVADFVGGKVKAIRVLRYTHRKPQTDPKEIQEVLRRVWNSSFSGAECGIVWDEATFWSIEASLEFEDGKTGRLVTNGSHVALLNHDHKSWFFRLPPLIVP